jgi:hypothetical protein
MPADNVKLQITLFVNSKRQHNFGDADPLALSLPVVF